jgi:hypothetical protein
MLGNVDAGIDRLQFVCSTALGQGANLYVEQMGSCGGGPFESARGSGDEAAADANRVFTKVLGPHAFEIHANGWKDWHVKNGEQGVRNAFFTGEIERDAAETEVHDPGAM